MKSHLNFTLFVVAFPVMLCAVLIAIPVIYGVGEFLGYLFFGG